MYHCANLNTPALAESNIYLMTGERMPISNVQACLVRWDLFPVVMLGEAGLTSSSPASRCFHTFSWQSLIYQRENGLYNKGGSLDNFSKSVWSFTFLLQEHSRDTALFCELRGCEVVEKGVLSVGWSTCLHWSWVGLPWEQGLQSRL